MVAIALTYVEGSINGEAAQRSSTARLLDGNDQP